MTIETETIILGAGLAGLTIAAGLSRAGRAAVVLEKSRGTGGRLATRRAGDLRFDHGAQYLRPKTPAFAGFLDEMKVAAAAEAWPAIEDGAPAMVGTPGMSALVKPLAAEADIRTGAEAKSAVRENGVWSVYGADGVCLARTARLVSAIPAPQVLRVFAPDDLPGEIDAVEFAPNWTLMAAFSTPLPLPDVTRDAEAKLSWVARNSSKPGRAGALATEPGGAEAPETWVAQAHENWSRDNLEIPKEDAAARMLDLLAERVGGTLPEPVHATAHRWRFSQAVRPLGQPCLADDGSGLVIAGDWCLGPRAEDAFHSARAALDHLV